MWILKGKDIRFGCLKISPRSNTRNFEYTITLGGWREALKLFKFKGPVGYALQIEVFINSQRLPSVAG